MIYMDNACQSFRPREVVDAISNYYQDFGSCAGLTRSSHFLARETGKMLERSRLTMANFIGAESEEIVWQPNTTYGLNLVASSLASPSCPSSIRLRRGDEIITTDLEQHSGLLPYWRIQQERGITLRIFKTDREGLIDTQQFQDCLTRKTRIVSIVWASNVTGSIAPIEEIGKITHDNGSLLVVDGAQYIPHHAIDVRKTDPDFLAFSVHKMCGPAGTGVLFGKLTLLDQMPPFVVGGETVSDVRVQDSTLVPVFRDSPGKFEPGLPNFAGIIGAGVAVEYLTRRIGIKNLEEREYRLTSMLMKRLESVPALETLGPKLGKKLRVPLATFRIRSGEGAGEYVPAETISTWMDREVEEYRVLIGAGGFETLPFLRKIAVTPDSTARASLYFYNTESEIEIFIHGIEGMVKAQEKRR